MSFGWVLGLCASSEQNVIFLLHKDNNCIIIDSSLPYLILTKPR